MPVNQEVGDISKIVVITGPTAVGKTDLAIYLARQLKGEIISADSMQIYRGMDIGTAKPTPVERKKAPHHLIDFIDPRETYSAGDFQRDARERIEKISSKKNLPLVVGGTGLYIQALLYGLPAGFDKKDPNLRHELREIAAKEGREFLHKKLRQCDPELASRIHPNDIQRVIRGLEVFKLTGRPLSELQKENQSGELPYRVGGYVLNRPREELYQRIDWRVEKMIEEGLEEEVRGLVNKGCNLGHTAMQGLGYRELYLYLQGELNRDEAVQLIKRNTRRYAKRQLTWFKNKFDFSWIRVEDSEEFFPGVLERIRNDLGEGRKS